MELRIADLNKRVSLDLIDKHAKPESQHVKDMAEYLKSNYDALKLRMKMIDQHGEENVLKHRFSDYMNTPGIYKSDLLDKLNHQEASILM